MPKPVARKIASDGILKSSHWICCRAIESCSGIVGEFVIILRFTVGKDCSGEVEAVASMDDAINDLKDWYLWSAVCNLYGLLAAYLEGLKRFIVAGVVALGAVRCIGNLDRAACS